MFDCYVPNTIWRSQTRYCRSLHGFLLAPRRCRTFTNFPAEEAVTTARLQKECRTTSHIATRFFGILEIESAFHLLQPRARPIADKPATHPTELGVGCLPNQD